MIKTQIYRIFSWKFIHEVSSTITSEFSDNYSGIQQNSTCNMESAQKRKMHLKLQRLPLQHSFLLTTHLLHVSLQRKTDNIFTIIRRMDTAERARAVGLLTAIRTDYVAYLHRPLIVECRRPKWLATVNEEFSLVCRKLRHLTVGDQDL